MIKRLRPLALVLIAGLSSPATAPAQGLFEDDRRFEEPPTLPESNNGTIRRGEGAIPERIDRLRDVFVALQSCWRRPAGSALSGDEITIRLAFRRSGEVLGQPRITYYRAGLSSQGRQAFLASIRDAFARCTPLRFTPAFGAAIAGRPFTFRFLDAQAL